MREGGKIKKIRLAIEQQYNAWFNVRICAFRGLDAVAFRRFGNYF